MAKDKDPKAEDAAGSAAWIKNAQLSQKWAGAGCPVCGHCGWCHPKPTQRFDAKCMFPHFVPLSTLAEAHDAAAPKICDTCGWAHPPMTEHPVPWLDALDPAIFPTGAVDESTRATVTMKNYSGAEYDRMPGDQSWEMANAKAKAHLAEMGATQHRKATEALFCDLSEELSDVEHPVQAGPLPGSEILEGEPKMLAIGQAKHGGLYVSSLPGAGRPSELLWTGDLESCLQFLRSQLANAIYRTVDHG